MTSIVEHIGINPGLADPWKMQIAMLPLRRPDPDAKRHFMTPAQEARANGCRMAADRAVAKTQSDIRAALRKMPGLTASEVALKIGRSIGYTHEFVRQMIDDGLIRREHGSYGKKPLYLLKSGEKV